MRKLLSRWFDFDYDITGEYYNADGRGRYVRKFNRRYKFRLRGGKKWHYLPTL